MLSERETSILRPMPTPEDHAREHIDQALEQAGWRVHDYKSANLHAGRGSPHKFSPRERARLRGLSPLCGWQGRRHHRSQERRRDPHRRGSPGREVQQGSPHGLTRPYPTTALSVSEHRRGDAIHERPRSPTSQSPCIQLSSTRDAGRLNSTA